MSLLESLSVALESLAANKMRTLLTMLGIIIGVSAVITMLALAKGASDRMMGNIQQMGTNVLIIRSGQQRSGAVRGGFGSSQTLTLEDAEAIKEQCESVERTAPEVVNSAQVKYRANNINTPISGTTPDYLDIRNYKVADGRFFTDVEVRSYSKVAVIGPTVSTNLFEGADPIGATVRIRGISFKVIGVTEVKGTAGGFGDPDDQIFIPVTTAMRRVFGVQYVRSISAQAVSMELMNQAVSEISTVLRKTHRLSANAEDDFDIRSQADIMAMADEASGIFTMLLGGIASVSLLVGGIGIMNIMLVSVTERTREIGIRMALGARRRDIQFQFLVESVVLSLLGGTIGVLTGFAGAAILSKLIGWNATVSLTSILMSFGFSAFVGIFFGMIPARKASALDPIEALRWE